MIRSVTLLENPTTLDGSPQGRAIMAAGLPYMNYGLGAVPVPKPAQWDWFLANGPKLPLKVWGIWMLANGGAPSITQDGILNVLLDQNKKYFADCGSAYPAATQPTAQYQLMPLGTVEYRVGQPRTFHRMFPQPVMLTADDCLIVDVGGTGGGSVQLAWALFYEP